MTRIWRCTARGAAPGRWQSGFGHFDGDTEQRDNRKAPSERAIVGFIGAAPIQRDLSYLYRMYSGEGQLLRRKLISTIPIHRVTGRV